MLRFFAINIFNEKEMGEFLGFYVAYLSARRRDFGLSITSILAEGQSSYPVSVGQLLGTVTQSVTPAGDRIVSQLNCLQMCPLQIYNRRKS